MNEIKFGTDGWRAIIGEKYTIKNVKIAAQAIADYVIKTHRGKRSIVVGYDARFMSETFAETVATTLAANKIKVYLSDEICTTPMVSYIVKADKLTGGVMITASHNPANYNGIKYKASYGGPADEEIIQDIVKRLHKKKPLEITLEEGVSKKLIVYANYKKRYLSFMRKYVNLDTLKRQKFNVLFDCMYGAGSNYIDDALKGTSCRLDMLHNERNTYFGGLSPEPIEKNLQELIAKVKKEKYDIGLAIDGDVDRIGAVDSSGTYYSTQTLIPLLIEHLAKNRNMTGAVVTTISGSRLIPIIAEKYGFTYYETPVGFKHICKIMREEDVLIGGEESGGIGFKNYIPERDGILSGILLIEMMAQEKKTLKELVSTMFKKYGKYLQTRFDCQISEKIKKSLYKNLKKSPPKKIAGKEVISMQTYDGIKFNLKDGGHLLLRLSGTEPILRIYAEGRNSKDVEAIIRFGERIAKKV